VAFVEHPAHDDQFPPPSSGINNEENGSEVVGHFVVKKTCIVTDLVGDVAIGQPMFLEIAWVDQVSESDLAAVAAVGDERFAVYI
jgi:hypothetical protein